MKVSAIESLYQIRNIAHRHVLSIMGGDPYRPLPPRIAPPESDRHN